MTATMILPRRDDWRSRSPPTDLCCCCWIPLSSLSLSWGTACSLYSHWCVNTHNLHLIETCQLGSHDEKKGNDENFRPADLGEQDLAKPWNAGGEKSRSGLRVLCSVARAGDGLRWIGGQLVGHSWVEYIAMLLHSGTPPVQCHCWTYNSLL